MKNQFIGVSLLILVFTAISISSFTPQQKEKKERSNQEQNKGKGNQGKGNQGKDNPGRGNQDQDNGKGNKGNNGNKGNQGNPGDDDDVDGSDDNNGRDKDKKVKVKDNGVYVWDRDTYRDRKKYKNQDKVTICHKFNRKGDPGVTITVSSNALKAHMGHGDIMGSCPSVNDNPYSDIFIRRRGDYYNRIQEGQEQVGYSQSILDYALIRLAESRLQLDQYRRNGMPAEEIQRKQATVVELEQNASLLETVLTAAALLVADKF